MSLCGQCSLLEAAANGDTALPQEKHAAPPGRPEAGAPPAVPASRPIFLAPPLHKTPWLAHQR